MCKLMSEGKLVRLEGGKSRVASTYEVK